MRRTPVTTLRPGRTFWARRHPFRSSGYSAHPIGPRHVCPPDPRVTPRRNREGIIPPARRRAGSGHCSLSGRGSRLRGGARASAAHAGWIFPGHKQGPGGQAEPSWLWLGGSICAGAPRQSESQGASLSFPVASARPLGSLQLASRFLVGVLVVWYLCFWGVGGYSFFLPCASESTGFLLLFFSLSRAGVGREGQQAAAAAASGR